MKTRPLRLILAPLFMAMLGAIPNTVAAEVFVQCPGDLNGDAEIDVVDPEHPNAVCRHMTGGDGFITMGDGYSQYMFGFADVTGLAENRVMRVGKLAANFPAPTIAVDEGDELYLTLSNVGMAIRPDLFDPHTVHYHGFPQAAPIFDGLPDASVSINQNASLTYYYNNAEPGTYMYHCHVEATEHMQMGMLGNLYVRPAQNRLPDGTVLGGHVHSNPDNRAGTTPRNDDDPLDGDKYVYNDGDGSTLYDVEYPIQVTAFDPDFHDASRDVQPLPFAEMRDRYPMMNGRGYPDTINPDRLANPENGGKYSQNVPSAITADQGERILLRISNLNVTGFYTLAVDGIPMTVVGRGARILRGGGTPDGRDLSFRTASVTLGGGETRDVILDTAAVPPGTYLLYTSNLNFLSNNAEDLGGLMTEIVIN